MFTCRFQHVQSVEDLTFLKIDTVWNYAILSLYIAIYSYIYMAIYGSVDPADHHPVVYVLAAGTFVS